MVLKALGGDFTTPPAMKNQCIALIIGLGGEGKTELAMQAPGPIAFMDIDRRAGPVLAKYQQTGKVIHYCKIDQPANISKLDDKAAKAVGQKAVDKLRKNHELAMEQSLKGNVRSIVWDTGTELGELFNLSKQGRIDAKTDDFGKSKGIIKMEFSKLIKSTRESNANLIILARAKELWENNKPTGKYTYQGLDTMEYDADWGGHIRVRNSKKGAKTLYTHELEIFKDGITFQQLGQVYREDDWADMGAFVYASTLIFPESGPDDWT
jgi:hypothetical protein